MAEDLSLFPDDPALHVVPPTPEPESADRRRTRRQAEVIAAGGHPLAAVWPTWRHPATLGARYTAGDERGRPYTCGTCAHREVLRPPSSARSFAKCTAGPGEPRVTGSTASDCRAWWPACLAYQPKEPPGA